MKEHLKTSIERDQGEDEDLGEGSGNSAPESLTYKEKFKENCQRNSRIF